MTDKNTTQHKVDEADTQETSPIRDTLFVKKDFRMHAGGLAHYKIECDALTDGDLETLAFIISEKSKQMSMGTMKGHGISKVIGVPKGGMRLAHALEPYVTPGEGITLIVDDVLTTGKSMEVAKMSCRESNVIGIVIFARHECPDWVYPIFSMKWFNTEDE